MKKKIAILIVTILVITSIVLLGRKNYNQQNSTVNGKPIVKIAAPFALTGFANQVPNETKEAMELAIEDMQQNPNLKNEYKFIYENNNFDTKRTQTIISKFKNLDKVDFVFVRGSAHAHVANSILADKEILLFPLSGDKNVSKNRKYSFNYLIHPDDEVTVMAKELIRRNITDINVFYQSSSYHLAQLESVEKIFPKFNITFHKFEVGESELDYSILLEKAKKTGANMSMLLLYPNLLDKLAPQLFMHNMDNMTSIMSFAPSSHKELFNGKWFVALPPADNEHYVEEMEKRLGYKTDNGLVYMMYAVVKYFIELCEEETPINGKISMDHIYNTLVNKGSFKMGDLSVNINSDGFISIEPTVNIIHDGKIELLEE